MTDLKLYIKTFGCQMNVYDSERVKGALEVLGYQKTEIPEEAEIILLNTCHIREKASEKLYSEIGRLSHIKQERLKQGKNALIVVMGCVVQAEREELMKRAPQVDIALGPQNYHQLPRLIAEYHRSHKRVLQAYFPKNSKFDTLPKIKNSNLQSFLAIQEGCDNFCTYCVVPYTRGCEYSRTWDEILQEAQDLVLSGAKEIMLLGQNVNCWISKNDKGQISDLGDLVRALAKIEGLERIRYTTSYPSKMTQNLIDAHADTPKLMPYVHLPIQSGSNKILKSMNRKYTVEGYIDIIQRFRKTRPDIAISSDFIVGFPGETEADFQETLSVVKEVNYASSFSFKYSARPGTPASLMKDQVHEEIKTLRLQQLQELLFEQQKSFNKACLGKDLEVFFTEKSTKHSNQYIGLSPFLQNVHFESQNDILGKIKKVRITDATMTSLTGQEKS